MCDLTPFSSQIMHARNQMWVLTTVFYESVQEAATAQRKVPPSIPTLAPGLE